MFNAKKLSTRAAFGVVASVLTASSAHAEGRAEVTYVCPGGISGNLTYPIYKAEDCVFVAEYTTRFNADGGNTMTACLDRGVVFQIINCDSYNTWQRDKDPVIGTLDPQHPPKERLNCIITYTRPLP